MPQRCSSSQATACSHVSSWGHQRAAGALGLTAAALRDHTPFSPSLPSVWLAATPGRRAFVLAQAAPTPGAASNYGCSRPLSSVGSAGAVPESSLLVCLAAPMPGAANGDFLLFSPGIVRPQPCRLSPRFSLHALTVSLRSTLLGGPESGPHGRSGKSG